MYVTKTTNSATMKKDSAKLKHNHRDEYTIQRELEKDSSRSFGDISKDEVWLTLLDEKHKSYESIVNDIFKDSLKAYNDNQIKNRHKDRVKATYSSYWKDNKRNKCDSPVVEMIVQVGGTEDSKKDYATGLVDPEIGKQILKDFLTSFQELYPLLKVIDCTYHQGEATPHIHLDFLPIADDKKLIHTASLDKACEQMGYGEVSGKRVVHSVRDFQYDFHQLLDDICMKHGIEIDHPHLTREHESVIQYRKNETLRQEQSDLNSKNSLLVQQNNRLIYDNIDLDKKHELLISENKKLNDEKKALTVDINSKKTELYNAKLDNVIYFEEINKRKQKAEAEVKWYETRACNLADMVIDIMSILDNLKRFLENITVTIFRKAGIELSKTLYKYDNGNIAFKLYKLENTNDVKVEVDFNNVGVGGAPTITLAENEVFYISSDTDVMKQIEAGIKNGTAEVNIFTIDETEEPDITSTYNRTQSYYDFDLTD